jgi:hypothetical protein
VKEEVFLERLGGMKEGMRMIGVNKKQSAQWEKRSCFSTSVPIEYGTGEIQDRFSL